MIIRIGLKALEFEEISYMESVIIPIYSMVMFFKTVEWNKVTYFLIPIILFLSYLIVEFQLLSVEMKQSGQ